MSAALFCWHRWEVPAYVDALNLRHGFKRCQKCNSIKGFDRFVPLDPDAQRPEPTGRVVSLVAIVQAIVMLLVFGVVGSSLMPPFLDAINQFANDPNLPEGYGPIFTAIPAALGLGFAVAVLSLVVGIFRPNETYDGDEVEDFVAEQSTRGAGRRSSTRRGAA